MFQTCHLYPEKGQQPKPIIVRYFFCVTKEFAKHHLCDPHPNLVHSPHIPSWPGPNSLGGVSTYIFFITPRFHSFNCSTTVNRKLGVDPFSSSVLLSYKHHEGVPRSHLWVWRVQAHRSESLKRKGRSPPIVLFLSKSKIILYWNLFYIVIFCFF